MFMGRAFGISALPATLFDPRAFSLSLYPTSHSIVDDPGIRTSLFALSCNEVWEVYSAGQNREVAKRLCVYESGSRRLAYGGRARLLEIHVESIARLSTFLASISQWHSHVGNSPKCSRRHGGWCMHECALVLNSGQNGSPLVDWNQVCRGVQQRTFLLRR